MAKKKKYKSVPREHSCSTHHCVPEEVFQLLTSNHSPFSPLHPIFSPSFTIDTEAPTAMSSSEQKTISDKRKTSAKMLVALFPRIPKTATVLLEFFIKRESKISLLRDPLSHFCQEEVVLHAQECLIKLNKQVINYQDLRDMVENLVGLHSMCTKKDPEVAKTLATTVRKLTIIVGEVATSLEKIAEVSVTDWMGIGDAIVNKLSRVSIPKQPPFSTYIPKMRDFKCIKMLGAGGFGAVYLTNYKPANFTATVKLVAMDRFSRHKQAAMDKVVASVVRNPFLEAYVTVMEHVPGLDLMRVVTKEEYMQINVVQIIMAQLILAIEHLHLRGFLHRDIKVSNMLILPGGRVKVIDFDTTKVCSGHFAKRLLRGYFRRTPFEFNDGESAGTIPYMAPEILKRRPYGRAADWWSSGIVMYKLMTGRVPYRGKTKQLLRERIITAPLKWPRAEEHPHSATTTAKDMTYRMLKKNPIERLGSRSYDDLKTHPFFDRFSWKQLYQKTQLCNIPSIQDLMSADADREGKAGQDTTSKRKHLQLEDMTDVSSSSQKPLLCFASPSYKKLMVSVKQSKTQLNVSGSFMNTTATSSSGIDYNPAGSPGQSSLKTMVTSLEGKDSQLLGPEKVDLILFRKKKFSKYWGFGFSMQRVAGEEDNTFFVYVDNVTADGPADRSQLLPLDVILSVNGTPVGDLPLGKVKKLVGSSADQMVLSVMSSSVYRLLTTRRDMMAFVRTADKLSVVVAWTNNLCSGNRPYGMDILDANTWDESAKQYAKVFVLLHTDVVTVTNNRVFPGDVVTHVDGTSLEGLTKEDFGRLLRASKQNVTLSVVSLSPFRLRRIPVSKLRETVLTDVNIVSRSTAAELET
ncbi:microtubule-associated serine/threonine-protein kinase 3-like isoform X2 [Ornithodoros turicata]|uniref:microtubule-associated serine/threonine-protein kinase 3-like isoform X2 n=1 Tax=Ornithodoros turicata TaxID=34597 RepID=UPI0031397C2A